MTGSAQRQKRYREERHRRGWKQCTTFLRRSHWEQLERLRRAHDLPGLHEALAMTIDAGLGQIEPAPADRDDVDDPLHPTS